MTKNIGGVFLWLAMALAARPATIYVATNGMDSRTGLDYWTNAVLTINTGTAKAVANDTVLVSNGEYVLTAQIDVDKQITIRSWNNGWVDPTNTIVNGDNSVKCFSIAHTGAVLEGLTIYNGRGAMGGGVYMDPGGTLRNCTVISNQAVGINACGGGIYINQGTNVLLDNCRIAHNIGSNAGGVAFSRASQAGGLVTNCVIRDNRETKGQGEGDPAGGGIVMGTNTIMDTCRVYGNWTRYNGGGVSLFSVGGCIVRNCCISNNTAYLGGGIYGNNAAAYGGGISLITNCIIIDNHSTNGYGAGINSVSSLDIIDCRIVGNEVTWDTGYGGGIVISRSGNLSRCHIGNNKSGYRGGGIYLFKGGYVNNCLIYSNEANLPRLGVSSGGGIYIYCGGTVENCTVVGNMVYTQSGGGIYGYQTGVVFNTIIQSNTDAVAGVLCNVTNSGNSMYYSNCCSDATNNLPGGVNIAADPCFADYVYGNYHLRKESPCINAGLNQDGMTGAVDLDGRSRIDKFSGIVDIGCYEYLLRGTLIEF